LLARMRPSLIPRWTCDRAPESVNFRFAGQCTTTVHVKRVVRAQTDSLFASAGYIAHLEARRSPGRIESEINIQADGAEEGCRT